MTTAHRFLGFGFAAADLLLEVRPDGRVGFALGAGETVLGLADTALTNRAWTSLIDPADHAMVEALFRGLDDGTRGGTPASPPSACRRTAGRSRARSPAPAPG